MPKEYEVLANDVRVAHETGGGFNFVHLYDADDHESFMLGEDEILALYRYLGKVIEDQNLEPERKPDGDNRNQTDPQ